MTNQFCLLLVKRYNMHVQNKNVYICVYIYVALKCKTNFSKSDAYLLYDPRAVMHFVFLFYIY